MMTGTAVQELWIQGVLGVQIRGSNLLFEDNDKTTSIEPEE